MLLAKNWFSDEALSSKAKMQGYVLLVTNESNVTNEHTVKLGYNEHAWDRLILLVVAIIRYNHQDLCTKVAIGDQKFQI
jgi:hypothetical protein